MAITLRLRREGDTWYPAHPELNNMPHYRGPELPIDVIRESLFTDIERDHPGVYTLEYSLEYLRFEAFKKIDARSDALIAAGFTYQDTVFSCSLEAQIRYNAMKADAATLPYPLAINSLDDQKSIVLASTEDTLAFCDAAKYHVLAVVNSGTQVKDAVRNATTTAELLNFEDPRPVPTNTPIEP